MKKYYVLKKEIVAERLNDSFEQIILPQNSIVELYDRFVRYKGNVNRGIKNIYSTYRFKTLVKIQSLNGKTLLKLKTYEFTINDKFINDFFDGNYTPKNNLLIDLNSKLHKIFQEKVSMNKISS